jgi:hypothetical protein
MSVRFMAFWNILPPFGIVYGHLVYFAVIWYIFFSFWYVEKSGITVYNKDVVALALAAWRSGHRIRHKNEKTRV